MKRRYNYSALVLRRFGRLVAIYPYYARGSRKLLWCCLCKCGKEMATSGHNLMHGVTRSCGCLVRETSAKVNTIHGLFCGGKAAPRLYATYANMKQRCYNPNHPAYKWYGAKGVTMCADWRGKHGFILFYNWAMSHGYSENLTIDRRNPYKNYTPNNCGWRTIAQQQRNKRRRILLDALP
jgi:hypothetical protein